MRGFTCRLGAPPATSPTSFRGRGRPLNNPRPPQESKAAVEARRAHEHRGLGLRRRVSCFDSYVAAGVATVLWNSARMAPLVRAPTSSSLVGEAELDIGRWQALRSESFQAACARQRLMMVRFVQVGALT